MLSFNNNHIFTGYLKQLLSSFNLPNYDIFTDKKKLILELFSTSNNDTSVVTKIYRSKNYIKDDKIQYATVETKSQKENDTYEYTWHECGNYLYNVKKLNETKSLKITNNIYDYYTHEYLGNFLRFQRDYNNLNLMPLYNCFSNRLCSLLKIKSIGFDSEDKKYKIYMLPVKLFNEYTIAIDSAMPVELCCGFYGKNYRDLAISIKNEDDTQHPTKLTTLPEITHKTICTSAFNKPFIFSTDFAEYDGNSDQKQLSLDSNLNSILRKNECDLKLFIKLPADNSSSIVVLEGNYIGFNDKKNHWVTNTKEVDSYSLFKPITQLQLLRVNSQESYPFADRLIEYLIGNAITNLDENSDNIARIQEVLAKNDNNYTFYGIWENKINSILYDYMNTTEYSRKNEVNHDILGYADKDVEQVYKSTHIITGKDSKKYPDKKIGTKITTDTLADVNIYTREVMRRIDGKL